MLCNVVECCKWNCCKVFCCCRYLYFGSNIKSVILFVPLPLLICHFPRFILWYFRCVCILIHAFCLLIFPAVIWVRECDKHDLWCVILQMILKLTGWNDLSNKISVIIIFSYDCFSLYFLNGRLCCYCVGNKLNTW